VGVIIIGGGIIGGGIIGLATALQLTSRYQGLHVTVIEKEEEVAAHQTGHNSGVVHAGVYYAPGSLKAEFCRAARLPGAGLGVKEFRQERALRARRVWCRWPPGMALIAATAARLEM